jgi:hypothetical protein
VWAVEVIDEGEGKRKEGETALTNIKRLAKYKGTGSQKPQQWRKNDTK